MSRQCPVFYGQTSTKQRIKCLAQKTHCSTSVSQAHKRIDIKNNLKSTLNIHVIIIPNRADRNILNIAMITIVITTDARWTIWLLVI